MNFSIVDSGDCPFCLAKGLASMRPDRKGRPCFHCGSCGTRSFIHNESALEVFSWFMASGTNHRNLKQRPLPVVVSDKSKVGS